MQVQKLLIMLFCMAFLPYKNILAQSLPTQTPLGKKNKFYVYWGYNGSAYTKSDIHFKGTDYDFTLSKVVAKDRPTPFSSQYFFPTQISIPQNNWRIGYFLNDKYNISIAMDHMKYVMVTGQTVKITGNIQNSETNYDGVYTNKDIILYKNFLEFEHTNGLNYFNVSLRRSDNLLNFNQLKVKNIEINLVSGLEAGAVIPRSDIKLLNYGRRNEFQLAGFGLSGVAAVNVLLWRHLFIQGEYKGGYINMPNIAPTINRSESAKQQFGFVQWNLNVGSVFSF